MSHYRWVTFVTTNHYENNRSNAQSHIQSVASDIESLVENNTSTELSTSFDSMSLSQNVRDAMKNSKIKPLYNAVHDQLSVYGEDAVVVIDSEYSYGRSADGQAKFPKPVVEGQDGYDHGLPTVAMAFGSDSRDLIGHEMLHCFQCEHPEKYKYREDWGADPATIMHGYHGKSDCNGESPSWGGWYRNFKMSQRSDCQDKSAQESMEIYDVLVDNWRAR